MPGISRPGPDQVFSKGLGEPGISPRLPIKAATFFQPGPARWHRGLQDPYNQKKRMAGKKHLTVSFYIFWIMTLEVG